MSTMSDTLTHLLSSVARGSEANYQRYATGQEGPYPCYVCDLPVDDFDNEPPGPPVWYSNHFSCVNSQVSEAADPEQVRFLLRSFRRGQQHTTRRYANLYGAYVEMSRLASHNHDHWSWIISDARTGEVHAEFVGQRPDPTSVTI